MSKNVLVLFSFRSHKHGYIEMLFSRLTQKARNSSDLSLHRGSLKDLHISIKNNQMSIKEALTGRNLEDFNLVYFELWYKAQQQALAAATFLQRKKIPFFSGELLGIMPLTKVGELARLADNSIPLPDTFTSSNRELKKIFRKTPPFGYPFILKAADGYGGKDNYLVKNYEHLTDILKSNMATTFIAQQFIPNDRDYRCLVFGGEVKIILERKRSTGTHLNNTSQGAVAALIPVSDLPAEAIYDVKKAANLLQRDEFAGVDMVIDSQTGQHFILEVNQTPQIEIGAEVETKMDALLEYFGERLKKV